MRRPDQAGFLCQLLFDGFLELGDVADSGFELFVQEGVGKSVSVAVGLLILFEFVFGRALGLLFGVFALTVVHSSVLCGM